MSSAINKSYLKRIFEEGINQDKPEVFAELLAPNYVNHSLPASASGAEGFRQIVGMFKGAFPDFRVTLEEVIAEGDKVASRGYFTGNHQGEFMGIAPTGRAIHASFIDIWRIEQGQFVENWAQLDMMTMMQQLGAIPTPDEAA